MYICTNVPIYHMLNKPADTAYTHICMYIYTCIHMFYVLLLSTKKRQPEVPIANADVCNYPLTRLESFRYICKDNIEPRQQRRRRRQLSWRFN